MLGITAAQFHLPFYMSRTLPNTFATALACLALGDWVSGLHPRRAIALLVFGTVRAASADLRGPFRVQGSGFRVPEPWTRHISRCSRSCGSRMCCGSPDPWLEAWKACIHDWP